MKWLNVRRHSRNAQTRYVGGRGFSLVEVMIGIFILGIGIIAISALFPAGIAQQQFSNDDIIGPIVANNAMTVIRGKVSAEAFGTLEEFGFTSKTIHGDWGWSRPAFFFDPTTITINGNNYVVSAGTTSIFEHSDAATVSEIPWSQSIFGSNVPDPPILITQAERYYPMQSTYSSSIDQPHYVWDCMFRRFEGRVHVAVFVYRIGDPQNGPYRVAAPATADNPNEPPMPRHLAVVDPSSFGSTSFGVWDANFETVPGIKPATEFEKLLDPNEQDLAWQDSRQWIVDQNIHVHRVLSNFNNRSDNYVVGESDPLQVVLVRPASKGIPVPSNWLPYGTLQPVTDIWFIPLVDSNNRSLTPVYVTVQEL